MEPLKSKTPLNFLAMFLQIAMAGRLQHRPRYIVFQCEGDESVG